MLYILQVLRVGLEYTVHPTINWGSLFTIFGRHGHKIEAGPEVEGSGWAMASVRVDHTFKTVFL